MLRRIYWMLPNAAWARAALGELLQARIDWRHIHFAGREGTDLSGLHEANLLQTSDLIRSAEAGLVIGAALGGLLGALVAVHYPIVGDEPQWELAVALAIAGALFGPWASSMIGVSTPSERLKRFAPQLAQGQILLMVDVPVGRVEQIEARLRTLHPAPPTPLEGSRADAPAFP